jgi:predicted metal-dependent HD superfamily phosphohydrolase
MADRLRFEALWERTIGPAGAAMAFAEIDRRLGDVARAYHNWSHIDAMLRELDIARGEAEFADVAFDEVELAIFFHDAVYDPLAKDNEACSADLFREMSSGSARMSTAGIARVCAKILATAAHAPSRDPSTRLLLDLDLGILGSDAAGYARYAAAVRKEYAAVPDEAWQAGRPAVLRRFLQRERIYKTEYFFGRLEVRARANIEGEIRSLTDTAR